MKKSPTYIYPRPLAKQRYSWRLVGTVMCIAIVVYFFLAHNDGFKLAYIFENFDPPTVFSPTNLSNSQLIELINNKPENLQNNNQNSKNQVIATNYINAVANLEVETFGLTVSIPDINIEQSDSSSTLAARALATEEEAQRPGLLQAVLGDRFSFLPWRAAPTALPDQYGIDEKYVMLESDFFVENSPLKLYKLEDLDLKLSDFGTAFVNARQLGEPVVYKENNRYTIEYNNDGHEIFRSEIAKGDTAGVILNEWLPSAGVLAAIAAAESVYPLNNIRTGRQFFIVRNAKSGEFIRFGYEVDKTNRLLIERTEEGFLANKELIEYEIELAKVSGVIKSSLFETVADCNEGPVLAVNLAEVFSCEINFITEIRQGDSFEVIVEKLYRDGEFNGYGKMLAANFVNRGKPYEAFLFADKDGKLRYYNANGEALQRFLLKAPLSFTRVSSGFSMNRRHPVFGDVRPHQGVDYAAPTGTPVKAVGDGVVVRAGWGNGYGNMIVIKHAAGLESQYAHLSGFARGLGAGSKVTQGQTIGYVGATGTATGPHLDFRLKQGDHWIDPAKAIVPRLDPIGKDQMPSFEARISAARGYLCEDTELAQYDPQAWGNP